MSDLFNIISITEKSHDNHDSIKTLREVYQGTHSEFSCVCKDEVQRALENNNHNKSCGWEPGATPKTPYESCLWNCTIVKDSLQQLYRAGKMVMHMENGRVDSSV